MEIRYTFQLPDITNWWHQQDETHSNYANHSNVAHDIVSIIPHGVGVEASFSLGRDVIGWRQSKSTDEVVLEMSLWDSLLEPMMECWRAIAQHQIPRNLKTTWNRTKTRKKMNCTEWPRSMNFCRCGRAVLTYVLHRRNIAHKTSKWQP